MLKRSDRVALVWVLALVGLLLGCDAVAGDRVVDLDETWNFAIDPLEKGEAHGWNRVPSDWNGDHWIELRGWDKVEVPHDFLTDKRYEWTGLGWYRKSVNTPDGGEGAVYRLQFDRVGMKCEVWVNGEKVGSHVGGYTPFEIDVTEHIRPGKYNHVAVRADNRTVEGDTPGPRLGGAPAAQQVPWWNFGGLLGSVRMVVSPGVYVVNQKIETEMNGGSASVSVKVWVRNGTDRAREGRVRVKLHRDGDEVVKREPQKRVRVGAGETEVIELKAVVPADLVELWSPDSPVLYESVVSVSSDVGETARADRFGIRTVEIKDGQFLLNGEPVRMAGANRAEGHPVHGGLEPAELVKLDMELMKRGHMEFHRLQHYPLSKAMLDWADEHGMLIILETPSWGLGPRELSDERYQASFRTQMVDQIESRWNHASVVGWSVGNEYQSWTPEAVEWTKMFVKETKALDATRPTTFAALGYAPKQKNESKEQYSMHWVDFVCINFYTSGNDAGNTMDMIHRRWPDKPIMISEYGQRADQSPEPNRIKHFKDTLKAVRDRDYVIGLCYWSFNDYRSRYPGTNVNGYRPVGRRGPDRTPREIYGVMQEELSPAVLRVIKEWPLMVRVASREDFPSKTLRGYALEVLDASGEVEKRAEIQDLAPGEDALLDLGEVEGKAIRLVRPTGDVMIEIHR